MSGYILYLSVFVGAVLLFELVAVSISASRERSGAINRRLKLIQTLPRGDEVLNVLREERNTEGPAALRSLRRLYVQSGMMIGALQFAAFAGAGGFVLAAATGLITGNSLYA